MGLANRNVALYARNQSGNIQKTFFNQVNIHKMENYANAALRHWNDARLLERENSVENADHLYGFVAECAIKKVLVVLPAFSTTGMLEMLRRVHVNILWKKLIIRACRNPILHFLRCSNQLINFPIGMLISAILQTEQYPKWRWNPIRKQQLDFSVVLI